jgi:hypothetical protein
MPWEIAGDTPLTSEVLIQLLNTDGAPTWWYRTNDRAKLLERTDLIDVVCTEERLHGAENGVRWWLENTTENATILQQQRPGTTKRRDFARRYV